MIFFLTQVQFLNKWTSFLNDAHVFMPQKKKHGSCTILGYAPLTAHLIIITENRTGGLVAQGESRDYRYDQREKQGLLIKFLFGSKKRMRLVKKYCDRSVNNLWFLLDQVYIILPFTFCFWFVQRSRSYRRSSWAWQRPWSVRSAVTRTWRPPSCPVVTWSAVWTVPPPWGSAPCVVRSSRAQSKPTSPKFLVSIGSIQKDTVLFFF